MSKELNELRSRISAWTKAYNALIDETDHDAGDVSDDANARFDELHEEAQAIQEGLDKLTDDDATRQRHSFGFLFRNVRTMGRSPREVIALCADLTN